MLSSDVFEQKPSLFFTGLLRLTRLLIFSHLTCWFQFVFVCAILRIFPHEKCPLCSELKIISQISEWIIQGIDNLFSAMMNFSESGFVLVKIKCLLELCKLWISFRWILKILSALSAKLIKLQDSVHFVVVNLILTYVTVDWVVVLRFFTFYSTLF